MENGKKITKLNSSNCMRFKDHLKMLNLILAHYDNFVNSGHNNYVLTFPDFTGHF